MALNKSAEHGYRTIEFAYLRPEKFNLDRLAKLAQSLGLEIGVTMGLPVFLRRAVRSAHGDDMRVTERRI